MSERRAGVSSIAAVVTCHISHACMPIAVVGMMNCRSLVLGMLTTPVNFARGGRSPEYRMQGTARMNRPLMNVHAVVCSCPAPAAYAVTASKPHTAVYLHAPSWLTASFAGWTME
jgi:hypothetical protein